MNTEPVYLHGIRVYVDGYAPTSRTEDDGTVTPILCVKVDLLDGNGPRILVHPDRWDEFRGKLDDLDWPGA